MKKILIRTVIFLIVFITNLSFISCFRDNDIPKADLEFIEFKKSNTKNDRVDIYKLKFSSSIAISDKVFEKADFPHLTCLLTNKADFEIKDIDNAEIRLMGYFKSKSTYEDVDSLRNDETLNKIKKFEYELDVLFYNDTKSDNKYSSKEDIKKSLSDVSCIPCKLEQRFFMETYKFYLSNSMCVPAEDILKTIN
ncbi:hypothetical protein [Aquimarina sp. RZ0]|uniref:hypothetical protein n=1 Tax=Aquimarina sp. RZ0 TaxID=2607730 RepID=UPI0011F0B070|nr:hypothetical protein [Aquimarina sp. RZ0]KAA1243271.1 hypothetical protein F0000_21700 [Aquimarina sp. RZ0]